MHIDQSFRTIETHFGAGPNPPPNWIPVSDAKLTILVGVTGVGKSRTIEELENLGLNFTLLPNRRVITDHLIIGALQQADGVTREGDALPAVRDRKERFAYTRRYRELHSGGMAHALTDLWVAAEIASGLTVFDGLRGINEVAYAAQRLPQARFIALCAPDGIRIQRLLGRNDVFDQITTSGRRTEPGQEPSQAAFGAAANDATLKGSQGARTLAGQFQDAAFLQIDAEDEARLLTMLDQGIVTAEELAAKLAIVAEERRNYDPDATVTTLQAAAPNRLCIVDTVANGPEACAREIKEWLDS